MGNIKIMPLIIMIMMVIASFSNLFGYNIAGITVILGVIFFFINKRIEKQPFKGSGLDLKSIGSDLKNKKIWFWILLPLIMDVICLSISQIFLPEYIDYEIKRAGGFVAIQLSVASVFQFLFFALGEEIAWRAFFQKQLTKALPIIPVLLFSSLLFTLGHLTLSNPIIVGYGLLFTFINSVLYGVVFHKTNNAWVSTISHFSANIFSVIIFVLIR